MNQQILRYLLSLIIVSLLTTAAILAAAPTTDPTIIDEWSNIKAPAAPELKAVTIDPKTTALLILDLQTGSCNAEKRPRCLATVAMVKSLLTKSRAKGMLVAYSLTSKATPTDILLDLAPLATDPIVKASVDKFYGTDLEKILNFKGIKTVIITGTAAHGAVLGTSIAAAVRGYQVIIPVDGMSAEDPYAEQYTAWHMLNAPGTKDKVVLTKTSLISF